MKNRGIRRSCEFYDYRIGRVSILHICFKRMKTGYLTNKKRLCEGCKDYKRRVKK